jgi:hypothetical protein
VRVDAAGLHIREPSFNRGDEALGVIARRSRLRGRLALRHTMIVVGSFARVQACQQRLLPANLRSCLVNHDRRRIDPPRPALRHALHLPRPTPTRPPTMHPTPATRPDSPADHLRRANQPPRLARSPHASRQPTTPTRSPAIPRYPPNHPPIVSRHVPLPANHLALARGHTQRDSNHPDLPNGGVTLSTNHPEVLGG